MNKASEFNTIELLTNDEVKNYIKHAEEVLERPLDKSMIKQRDAGFGKKLSYISGNTVVNILNEAFGFWGWDFEVVDEKIIESIPKFNKKTNTSEDQPPYIQILGRLTVPVLGVVKEQYGTKVLLGGSSEQEGAAKSAGTDALKKCASLLGIGNELYEDTTVPEAPKNYSNNKPPYEKKNTYTKKEPVVEKVQEAKPAQDAWNDASTAQHAKDLKQLSELKTFLGITENSQLDAFVQEFTSKKDASFTDIVPSNIEKFNEFLQPKVPAM